MHVAYRPGLRHPLAVGAPGRAILLGRAVESDEPERLRRERRQGYAVSRGEIQPGAAGLAAPIAGEDASIGVVSFGEPDEDNAARVIEAATAIAAALGFRT